MFSEKLKKCRPIGSILYVSRKFYILVIELLWLELDLVCHVLQQKMYLQAYRSLCCNGKCNLRFQSLRLTRGIIENVAIGLCLF